MKSGRCLEKFSGARFSASLDPDNIFCVCKLEPRAGVRLPYVRVCNTGRMKASHARLLRLIAVFKFLKAAALIAISFGTFRLLHKDLVDVAQRWVDRLGLDPGKHYVIVALEKVSRIGPGEIKKLGIVGLIYAALFLTEGTGLWMLRRWGE